ncbi:glutathione-specific gamma-glutamylcyclotransferase [Podospora fimiseda]|uniref:glutathione-specific gamma-glutamylcyclotransferase n=1 Tax=Podospora fimiseda TaxID=252190 RepID=A0AAN7BP55_9PEZI|nr:glutathione-specific gamma-glutamylcyclotransferase [Podospora fimiseda]
MSINNSLPDENDEFWLFGYGSLIWKPPPHFDRRIPGWVTGYVRRFWQASEDHRGTPEAPGRVVTLIDRSFWEQLTDHHDTAPDKVWGVAYRIIPDRVAEVKEYLDIREINGYTIHYTPFHPAADVDPSLLPHDSRGEKGPVKTLVYIGTPDNEQFVGPQDPQELAEHIYRSEGPSGLNRDYLWGLEKALDSLSPESGDEHVTDLSNRVRTIAAREGGGIQADKQILRAQFPVVSPDPEESLHHDHHHHFKKVGSVEEQEETEKTS